MNCTSWRKNCSTGVERLTQSSFRPPNPELHYAAIPARQRALVTKSLARVGGTQEREGVQSGQYGPGRDRKTPRKTKTDGVKESGANVVGRKFVWEMLLQVDVL